MLASKKKLAFVAGRSGGHIIPALTLAKQENAEALFFSTDTALDKTILHGHGVQYIRLTLPNIPRSPINLLFFGFKFIQSLCTSIRELYRFKPEKLISTSGYIALPVCLAAYCLRIPITLYELNAIPGKATSWLAPLATDIQVCFQESIKHLPEKKCILCQYPLRFEPEKVAHKNETLRAIEFSPDKKTVLILGGSQGSLFINTLFQQLLTTNPSWQNQIQIIHQTGATSTDWGKFYHDRAIKAMVFDFQQDITAYYQAADLIICRAGAGTLFESIAFKKPCITIPLETQTTDHQLDNAYAMAKQFPDLVKVIRQHEVSTHADRLLELLDILLLEKQLQ